MHNSETVLDIKEDLLECIKVSREVFYSDWEQVVFYEKGGAVYFKNYGTVDVEQKLEELIMKIVAIQMKVALKQVEHNYANAEMWIRKAADSGADVVVLPEMWSGGFITADFDERLADVDGQRAQAFLSQLAGELKINIVGGSVATKKLRIISIPVTLPTGRDTLLPTMTRLTCLVLPARMNATVPGINR